MLESQIENSFIQKLTADLKYVYRDDIHDRQSLESNFREKFQALNKVHLTDAEFTRLMEELTNSDVFRTALAREMLYETENDILIKSLER